MTNTEREYLQFALAVLDGEPGAHKIVADLLEDQGLRGRAQWARSKKSNSRRRMEFAISLLPAEAALRLACDFVEHLLDAAPESAAVSQNRAMFERLIDRVRIWVEKSEPDPAVHDQLADIASRELDFATPGGFFTFHLESRIRNILAKLQQKLVLAVREQEAARKFVAAGDDRRAGHHRGCAMDSVRKLIRTTGEDDLYRTVTQETANWFQGVITRAGDEAAQPDNFKDKKNAELRWQIEHTRETIENLTS